MIDSLRTQEYALTSLRDSRSNARGIDSRELIMTFNLNEPTRFRTAQNVRLTRGLFLEWAPDTALYTLRDQDYKGKPSLYRIYMEISDPTEYQFATAALEGWEHWQMLAEATWFKPYVQRWRTELELKIKSEALKRIGQEAQAGSKASFAANKFLVEKGYIDKTVEPNRRGRPTKAEIERKAKELAFDQTNLQDDIKRIGLN